MTLAHEAATQPADRRPRPARRREPVVLRGGDPAQSQDSTTGRRLPDRRGPGERVHTRMQTTIDEADMDRFTVTDEVEEVGSVIQAAEAALQAGEGGGGMQHVAVGKGPLDG